MERVIRNKIKIGISSCMYGSNFRYNGKGYDITKHIGRDRSNFIWYPICPEVNGGLGIPRSPIHVSGESGDNVWDGSGRIRDRSGRDQTDKLISGCVDGLRQLKENQIKVYIFMEGSPSCGIYRTSLKNNRLGKPPGVFGSLLLKEEIFLIPAMDLQSPIKKWDWFRRMYSFLWVDEMIIDSKDSLYEMWHTVKFLCQEVDEKRARILGRKMANLGKYVEYEKLSEMKREVLMMLRKPSSLSKIKNRLWKHYKYYEKKMKLDVEEVYEPRDNVSMGRLAKKITEIELELYDRGEFFSLSPILNRSGR